MKITGDGNELSKYVNETALRQTDETNSKTTKRGDAPQQSAGNEGAIVTLSETSKEIQRAREVIEAEPDVRREEVEAIKNKVEKGTYEVDAEKTAEKMLESFLDEMI
jgi:negative regulator of flagellin synthesis FlgM